VPTTFKIHASEGFYIAEYVGLITDAGLLSDYESLFSGDEWSPEMNELADLSRADFDEITTAGLYKLVSLVEEVSKRHGTVPRVAVYAPHDLPYGLARIYSASAEKFGNNRVFRDLDEAKAWLCQAR